MKNKLKAIWYILAGEAVIYKVYATDLGQDGVAVAGIGPNAQLFIAEGFTNVKWSRL